MEDGKMDDRNMGDGQQGAVQTDGAGEADGGINSAWMRRHLSDSIYLWACGEKADHDDDDIKLSDRLTGWIILFVQGFAYTMLIVLARTGSADDTGSSGNSDEDSGFLLPTVTGAMYLLVASTTHDLCAGFSLLVDGLCAGHRAFGFGLLIVHGVMVVAAMTVLVSTSDDSASVVLNAVTVLFVADLDEKALKLFLTVPQNWRLFMAIQSISISFALALIAIVYVGGASPLLKENHDVVETFPTWFVWGINPTAVTLSSLLLSSMLEGVCDFCSEAMEGVEKPMFGVLAARLLVGLLDILKKAKERVRREPCFYFSLVLWAAHAVASVFYFSDVHGFPAAFTFSLSAGADDKYTLAITDNKLAFVYVNVVLFIGLAMKVLVLFLPRHEHEHEHDTVSSEPGLPAGGNWRIRAICGSCRECRAPSLLVGWGIGYWLTSVLYVIGCSWPGGGWKNAPTLLTIAGYIVPPSFWFACIFMVADPMVLGPRFAAVVKPAVDVIRDRRRVEFWTMTTVLCNVLTFWIGFCTSFRWILDYYWL